MNAAWKRVYGDPLDLYDKRLTQFQEYYKQSVKAILGMDADSRLAPRALLHLWGNLITFTNVWLGKLSADKKDGWTIQDNAERGQTRSKLVEGTVAVIFLIGALIYSCLHFREYLTSKPVQMAIQPYLEHGWVGLF
ncbi:hypothetical protein OH784_12480 [Ectobacillus funiculus]|uniref:hypothetical protein n=1 Tax=Ectobacillus funiculus TaxID=137993 RepID=UPI003979E6F7